MAELATIARPYAEALFKTAVSDPSGDLEATSTWLDEFAAIAIDPELQYFAENPKTTDAEAFDLISGVVQSPLTANARNFLRVLIENGRLQVLPEIANQFHALKNARSGSSDAVVYSAFPIDGAALDDLAVTLEERFKRRLNVSVEVDPDLIGGVRVVVGDEVLDTSVKARLEQMKIALTA
ncbi:MAG: F0F1 ATP synthase subunit delta [Burkholderiaceae bacterium]